MTEEKTGMSTGRKVLIALIVVFLLLTAAAYFYGVSYFGSHFLPGSYINGLNCSYMTADEAENLLTEKIKTYALTLETKNNGQEGITAKEMGLSYKGEGSVQALLQNQEKGRWFLSFSEKKEYQASGAVVYNEEMVRMAIEGLFCVQNAQEPVDASIKETEAGYEIVPETEGNAPDKEKLLNSVVQCALLGETRLNLEEEGCYKKPSVYQSDENLKKDCDRLNKLTDVVITYDFADKTETVDRSVIKSWIVRGEDGSYTLDKEKAAEYVNNLGYKYDTFGCTRDFRTYDGRIVTISGGDYGWAIDQEAETEALYQAILNGETQVREPIYAYSAWSRDTTNDIGYTYVEIDLTNQRMVFYKDGVPVVDTPIVTGHPGNTDTATPVGCYAIDAKQSPATLTGEDYEAPVTFWLPFAGNVGIHDASWRTEFGGTLYMTEGSHGCVNTPYGQAQIIYNNIEIGAPVIVYQ